MLIVILNVSVIIKANFSISAVIIIIVAAVVILNANIRVNYSIAVVFILNFVVTYLNVSSYYSC